MKEIEFSEHALEQMRHRGTNPAEVIQAIRTAEWIKSKADRYECRLNFRFDDVWNGIGYHLKQVRPIFVLETDTIVIITVYTYYFNE
ncbi:MAG: DUF4258 domain-containing protein [Calditrichaeota bacterium]|nr:DUF4258 domain-containing protein [Calditrichota bacterium]